MCMDVMPECLCALCSWSTCRSQKSASDIEVLELQTLVSHYVDVQTRTQEQHS